MSYPESLEAVRLSDADRTAIRAAVAEAVERYRKLGHVKLTPDTFLAAERVGAWSIGCRLVSLRDAEIAFIGDAIHDAWRASRPVEVAR